MPVPPRLVRAQWCDRYWQVMGMQGGRSGNSIGYESIPINTIFRGMNIHLPAIVMFTRGTRFWHTANWLLSSMKFELCLTYYCTRFVPCTRFLPSQTNPNESFCLLNLWTISLNPGEHTAAVRSSVTCPMDSAVSVILFTSNGREWCESKRVASAKAKVVDMGYQSTFGYVWMILDA